MPFTDGLGQEGGHRKQKKFRVAISKKEQNVRSFDSLSTHSMIHNTQSAYFKQIANDLKILIHCFCKPNLSVFGEQNGVRVKVRDILINMDKVLHPVLLTMHLAMAIYTTPWHVSSDIVLT